ncbi:hypothetical protein U1Q18_042632 [Sarracenia purpurea var. burkii]
MERDQKELQFLPTAKPISSPSRIPSRWSSGPAIKFRSTMADQGPPLDLQLSISARPIAPPPATAEDCVVTKNPLGNSTGGSMPEYDGGVEALKWQAAEQIRLAAVEKAYAERVRELTKREMEMAQSELARARLMWERAREEVDRAERMKERASRQIDSACMEITCQSCKQKFRA